MSKLALVAAVIIHHPDFFVAGAIADKIDFAFGDAGNAAAQTKNNFIGKFVGDQAGRVIGGERRCIASLRPAAMQYFSRRRASLAR